VSGSGLRNWYHWQILLLALAVPCLAAVLDVVDGQRVCISGWPDYPLPEICPSRRMFSIDCPACGLTRSIILLMEGDWRGSVATHRLGWLIFLLILLQIPYRGACLRHPWVQNTLSSQGEHLFWALLILVLVLNRIWDWG
jgi:hypothetical protein